MRFDIIYHYGDTGVAEAMLEEEYASQEDADARADELNNHISACDWELGDYYTLEPSKD